jgi:hypothetical protein
MTSSPLNKKKILVWQDPKTGWFLEGNPKTGGVQHHNCIVEVRSKSYPDQNGDEQQCSTKGDPEYLDNSTEQHGPEKNDCQETIEC